MRIVLIALDCPDTFVVLALLILILSPVVILRTRTDIFPNINIPVIAVTWTYSGLNPEEVERRITSVYERVLTTTVDNIEHIESTTYNGQTVVKIFLQPNASLETANAQVTSVSQAILRQLPPGELPPFIQLQRIARGRPDLGPGVPIRIRCNGRNDVCRECEPHDRRKRPGCETAELGRTITGDKRDRSWNVVEE